MAGSKQLEKCFFKEIYSCGSGKLIQSSRIDAILSASAIRQDEIRLRPELSDGTTSVLDAIKTISKYVSPSTLANMSKRVNDDNKSDDPEVGTKQMSSSTACAFEFRKHCLFCTNGTTCKLLHEYDDKVPHQCRIPASLVTPSALQRTKSIYLTYVRNGAMMWVKLSVLAFMVHLLISMQQMLDTTANAINPSM